MIEVRAELLDDGYRLYLANRQQSLFGRNVSYTQVSDWQSGLSDLPPLTAAIIDELDHAGNLTPIDAASKLLRFEEAAQIQNSDAELLNLLPPFPYQLDVLSRGSLGAANFEVYYSVTQGGVRVAGTFSKGVFTTGASKYRIAGLLFSLLDRIRRLNDETNAEGKIAQFAALRLLLPDIDPNIRAEGFLLRIRIAHVTAISLKPSIVDGLVSFDPIPMRRVDPENHEAGAELAIAPIASEKFGQEFRNQRNVNSTYALEPGHYVYIDPSVRPALKVVKQKQTAPLDERMAFLMSPAKALTEAYGDMSGEVTEVAIGDTIFFETAEYSDRITGIGEWLPPQLSYLERGSNNWLPERFSIVLSGKLVTGEPKDVPGWIEEVKAALAEKKTEVRLGGVDVPIGSPGLLETLQRLKPDEPAPKNAGSNDSRDVSETPKRRIKVFQTKSNFEVPEFRRHLKPRQLGDISLPAMKVRLKEHQEGGVRWLTNSYLSGWPGVLLADDMGLGKTLQSLSFLMVLLREGVIRIGRPAIVVAPTSLLRNWQDEHGNFALGEGLGKPLVAFGSQLRHLRLGNAGSDGVTLLDAQQLVSTNWILTTYETIRDYHISFAQVPFSVAVLDEVQKAKNPSTRVNAALKALNADFVLSMTGTPVENSISDLWAITDITAPGYFPPLKEFMKSYGKAQPPETRHLALEKLSTELLGNSEVSGKQVPPYAFRRMKEDVAKDLPTKHQGRMIRAFMPEVQARRYAEVSAATQAGKVRILRALHDFRSISLHPADPETVVGGLVKNDDYIKMSARLTKAFDRLEQIAMQNEKVIIFVNNRRMQTVLSRLIKQKFGCPTPEYIRGDTIPGQRQEIVNRFSSISGFAALILSPRAAGVGLNIVAANHVIHLDRWWNPAVEDQCTDRAYRIGATKDVYVYTIGAVHPVLQENSYDVILDALLQNRRETSRRIFTSCEITVEELSEALKGGEGRKTQELLNEIDRSGYLGLEEFVRDQLLSQGWNANLTKRSGDGGADIVVKDELGEIIYLIQCKYTADIGLPIDAGLLSDAQRVRVNWKAPTATVIGISNAKRFAPRVVEGFGKINGRLVARDELPNLTLS
jgi:hypothetical protein